MGTLGFALAALLLWVIGLQRLARLAARRSNADLDAHEENVTRDEEGEQG